MPNGEEARSPVQPWWVAQTQKWAGWQIENSHTEAIWAFGEFVLFTLMWNVIDFEAGRVDRCPVCYLGDRGAAAFEQPTDGKCPGCYGTTFEGGFRAQIIRPVIIIHETAEIQDGVRGEMTVDQVNLETTTDFTVHHGDYVFRSDGSRYQTSEGQSDSIQEGFSPKPEQALYANTIPSALLEDPTSVAYIIPTPGPLHDLLDRSNFGVRTAPPVTDFIRPGGYL